MNMNNLLINFPLKSRYSLWHDTYRFMEYI